MSNADYGERGGTATVRASSALAPVSSRKPTAPAQVKRTTKKSIPPPQPQPKPAQRKQDLSHAAPEPSRNRKLNTTDNLDLADPNDIARNELLQDSVFPSWQHDVDDETMESPEEMQKKDPLGTQIWKLYSRTKTRLPNQERMENLTWRMMAMNLRRREQMQAAYVVPQHSEIH